MENLLELFSSNPTYLIVAVAAAIVILLGMIKKLIKLALIGGAFLVLWVAYSIWMGEDASLENLKEKAIEAGQKAKDSAVKKVQEKAEEQIDKILPKTNF